jgi:hypothetical protein
MFTQYSKNRPLEINYENSLVMATRDTNTNFKQIWQRLNDQETILSKYITSSSKALEFTDNRLNGFTPNQILFGASDGKIDQDHAFRVGTTTWGTDALLIGNGTDTSQDLSVSLTADQNEVRFVKSDAGSQGAGFSFLGYDGGGGLQTKPITSKNGLHANNYALNGSDVSEMARYAGSSVIFDPDNEWATTDELSFTSIMWPEGFGVRYQFRPAYLAMKVGDTDDEIVPLQCGIQYGPYDPDIVGYEYSSQTMRMFHDDGGGYGGLKIQRYSGQKRIKDVEEDDWIDCAAFSNVNVSWIDSGQGVAIRMDGDDYAYFGTSGHGNSVLSTLTISDSIGSDGTWKNIIDVNGVQVQTLDGVLTTKAQLKIDGDDDGVLILTDGSNHQHDLSPNAYGFTTLSRIEAGGLYTYDPTYSFVTNISDQYQQIAPGVEDATDFTITYSGRQFTVTCATGAKVWCGGFPYSPTTTTMSAHANTTKNWYLYYDSSGVLTVSDSAWDIMTTSQVAYAYYNATDGNVLLFDERHPGNSTSMTSASHRADHFGRGTFVRTGCVVSSPSSLPATGANLASNVSAGIIQDEDIPTTIAQFTAGDTCSIIYRTGLDADGRLVEDFTSTTSILINGSYQMYWNQLSGGTWSLVAASSANKWYVSWVIAWPRLNPATGAAYTGRQIVYTVPQQEHSTLSSAQAEDVSTVSFGGLSPQEYVVIGRKIYKYSVQAGTTPDVEKVQEDNFRANRVSIAAAISTAHNSLTGRSDTGSHPIAAITGTAYSVATFDASGNGTSTAIADTLIPYGTATGIATNAALNFTAASGTLASTIFNATSTNLLQYAGAHFLAINTTTNAIAIGVGTANGLLGDGNMVFGKDAMGSATNTADYCVAIGFEALKLNKGRFNVAIGYSSMSTVSATAGATYGEENVAIGYQTLYSLGTAGNSAGYYNVAIGSLSGNKLTTGNSNTFIGPYTGQNGTTGYSNVGISRNALNKLTEGYHNNGIGQNALYTLTTGKYNTAIGSNAGYTTNGDNNVFIGYYAGRLNTGTGNVFVGYFAGEDETGSNLLYIANSDTTTPLIKGDFSAATLTVNGALSVNKAGASAITTTNSTVPITGGLKTTTTAVQSGSYTAHPYEFVANGTVYGSISSAGLWRIGDSTAPATYKLTIAGTSYMTGASWIESTAAGLFTVTRNTNSSAANILYISKSRGTTAGSVTTVQTGDLIGNIKFTAADGVAAFTDCVDMVVSCEGTIASGQIPGVWKIRTANASGVLTDALTINSSQNATFSGAVGIGVAPGSGADLFLGGSRTLTGTLADGYSGGAQLSPTYTAASAQTLTRGNYLLLARPSLTNVTVGDMCVLRFNAAAGTHEATVGATTKTTPGSVQAWVKININGTVHYIPAYTSTTA